jgi:hypothetical protein
MLLIQYTNRETILMSSSADETVQKSSVVATVPIPGCDIYHARNVDHRIQSKFP